MYELVSGFTFLAGGLALLVLVLVAAVLEPWMALGLALVFGSAIAWQLLKRRITRQVNEEYEV